MNASMTDRAVSALSYFTFGIFSIIWIIFANVTGRRITSFLTFNLYQAIFVSVILSVISLLYDIALGFLSVIPFIGKLARGFDIFFNHSFIFGSFTYCSFTITVLIVYLITMSLFGKKPYVPVVSDIIALNFGG